MNCSVLSYQVNIMSISSKLITLIATLSLMNEISAGRLALVIGMCTCIHKSKEKATKPEKQSNGLGQLFQLEMAQFGRK